MLWIALHLPQLPLETFQRGLPSPEPCAVAERQRILVCDAKAVARGLRAGMPVSAALALAPNLRLRELAALHREQPRPGHIKRIARARGKRNAH